MRTTSTLDSSRRSPAIAIVLAFLCGAGVFAFLWFVTGGFFVAVLVVSAIIAVLAFAHYLVWGRTMTSHWQAVYSDRRIEEVSPPVADTFNLPLDDRERAELLALLDRALTETPATATASEVLRGVRDRLQRYDA
jgi:hypothetical protein